MHCDFINTQHPKHRSHNAALAVGAEGRRGPRPDFRQEGLSPGEAYGGALSLQLWHASTTLKMTGRSYATSDPIWNDLWGVDGNPSE
jgi:hypothetical protein